MSEREPVKWEKNKTKKNTKKKQIWQAPKATKFLFNPYAYQVFFLVIISIYILYSYVINCPVIFNPLISDMSRALCYETVQSGK